VICLDLLCLLTCKNEVRSLFSCVKFWSHIWWSDCLHFICESSSPIPQGCIVNDTINKNLTTYH
jgi:hypothetical protein